LPVLNRKSLAAVAFGDCFICFVCALEKSRAFLTL
jgi:hypothetical protein